MKLKDKIFSPLGKLISNITPTPSILSSTLPRSSWHHLSPASTAILASSHAPSIVLVQHMIAGISTEPWHLAMVARVVELAVGWKGKEKVEREEDVWHLALERVKATMGSMSWCCRWSNMVSQMS